MKRREVPRGHQAEGAPPSRHAARRVLAGLAVALAFVVVTALRWEATVVVDPPVPPSAGAVGEVTVAAGRVSDPLVVVDRVVRPVHVGRATVPAVLPTPALAPLDRPAGSDDHVTAAGAVDDRAGSTCSRAPPA